MIHVLINLDSPIGPIKNLSVLPKMPLTRNDRAQTSYRLDWRVVFQRERLCGGRNPVFDHPSGEYTHNNDPDDHRRPIMKDIPYRTTHNKSGNNHDNPDPDQPRNIHIPPPLNLIIGLTVFL